MHWHPPRFRKGPGCHTGMPLPENDFEDVQMPSLFIDGGGDAAAAALAITEALGAWAIETAVATG